METCLTSDALYSPSSIHPSKPDAATLGSSKASYRSPLTGILQLQHVRDFCTLVVEVSTEAAKSLSEERKMVENGMDMNKAEIPVVSYHEDGKDHENQQNAGELSGNQGNTDKASLCESDGYGIQNGRPLSPGTLALMCDERDTAFNDPSSITEPNTRTNLNLESTHGLDQLYVEQERIVLTRLRNFLNRLITCASIEEMRVDQEDP